MATGYESAKHTASALARTVGLIAQLIDEPSTEPINVYSGTVLPGLGMREDAIALNARARDLELGLFTIIVLGEFKNGKSTLLNAMLGSKTLPAKAAPATAIITVLVYGDREDVAIYESGRADPRRISWDAFISEFQLTPADQETIEEFGALDRFAGVEYAEIERPHALCALGVKLIDSPGLGEHVSRTRVATEFLKRAQAVVMVLNATRILTRDERAFVETLGSGHLDHVFFVVNRIDQVPPDGLKEIEVWVRSQLAPHFLGPGGSPDPGLYGRRVFFVSARQALEARSLVPHDEKALAVSGLPSLETELERFLTGPEKIKAALQSTVTAVAPVIVAAERRIEETEAALDAPLDALEERRAESERRLEGLEGRRQDIERTILTFGDTIKRKVYADLKLFVDRLPETWDEDSHRLMDLDRALSLRSIATSYAQREARERMAATLSEEAQRYVQAKFETWSDRIAAVIEPDVAVLTAEVEAQIGDLQLELDRIAAAFAGTARHHRGVNDPSRLLQLALSPGEIAGLAEDVMFTTDLTRLVTRMVQSAIVVYLVGTFVTGSFFLAAVLVQAVQLGVREGEIKRRIRQGMGQRLHEKLAQQVETRRTFIYQAVEERFSVFASRTADMLARQIDEIRTDQERILRQKRDSNFSVTREKERLVTIRSALRNLQAEIRQD